MGIARLYVDDEYEHLRADDVSAIRIRADGSTDEQAGRHAPLPSRCSTRLRIATRARTRASGRRVDYESD